MVRQRPAAEGTRVTSLPLSRYNLIAAFPDLASARGAIQALGNAGVDADKISLTGPGPARAAEPTDPVEARKATREIDARMMKYLLGVTGAWTIGGLTAGAILGVPLTLLVLAIIGAGFTWGRLIAGVFLCALALGIAGWLIPHTSYPLQAAEPWELTFAESKPGWAMVGVHCERHAEIRTARQVLRSKSALAPYEVDSQGNRI